MTLPVSDRMLPRLLLGVDSGGSKTAAWLASQDGHGKVIVVGRGLAGSANPRDVGIAASRRAIQTAIDAAFAAAGKPSTTVGAAVLAVAGAAQGEPRRQIERWAIDARVASQVRIVADAEPILAADNPEGWGIALIAGTGSFAYGRDKQGAIATAGGYGYLVGDEGSGFWLGRKAIAAVIAKLENRGPETALASALAHEAGETTSVKDAVYRLAVSRQTIAALAPQVIHMAESGDTVATGIVDQGTEALANLVELVAHKLSLANIPFPLSLAGGVLTHRATLREKLDQRLQAKRLRCQPTSVVTEPVAGCIRLASQIGLSK